MLLRWITNWSTRSRCFLACWGEKVVIDVNTYRLDLDLYMYEPVGGVRHWMIDTIHTNWSMG